ncbi:ABC transporter substrate-binding protein [Roseateles sp. DAIF2]|uniref:ABC transporter substrate-binding protein n=1 Tax=Roseateles sp. DAIF2 TaxID=2714952 RepID=UPI0018A24E75|nr:ABC transporter substrate-binding protein [Roseateles sp. DAIF2]QPF74112.1 ABC transporter substrate-binding protein [Roseateles sp. DAIF2]
MRTLLSTLLLALAASTAAANTPTKGGTLTLVINGEPRTLVPLLDPNFNTRNLGAKVTEGLLRFDEKFQPQPLLATAWQVSADGLRYRFDLRRGVKWHDGKPFGANDVRFSLLALKQHSPRGRITFANLERIETPTPQQVVLHLSKPAPYLLKSLASAESPIVPEHAYGGPDANPHDSANNNAPIGTGPFIFEEWKRGSHVVLRRNPNYWRSGHPHLERIVARFVGDVAAASTALETGEADVSYSVSLPDLDRLSKLPQLRVEAGPDGYLNNIQVLEFNLEHPQLARQEVRHAIARAIDRGFIRDHVFFGRTRIVDSPIPAVLSSYVDDGAFQHPFNLAEANALLDKAGLPRGADGQRLQLRLSFLPGANFKRSAEYLRGALGRVGIKIEVLDGDLATTTKRVYQDRGFELNLNGLGMLFDPTVGVQRLYWSDAIRNPVPYVNAAHYNNAEVDELFRRVAVEADDARRAEQLKKIQRIVGRELPVFPLVNAPTVTVANKRVHGIVNSVDLSAGDFSDAWVEAR